MKSSSQAASGDESDLRLENVWSVVKISSADQLPPRRDQHSVAILSYADDEGVKLNHGRAGAAEGPAAVLKYLGRMVVRSSPEILVIDALSPERKTSLAERHAAAKASISSALASGWRVITVGGGHDYGYPDAAAYHAHTKAKILNVDAHLDLRPVIKDTYHSGTAFRRFVEEFGGQSLIQYGYWPHTNAASHESFAREHKVALIQGHEALPPMEGAVGLSICLDAFAGIRGVSAPQILGLSPERGLDIIRRFRHQSDWLGLYEVAPSLDPITQDSARLAAVMAYYFIHRDL